MPLLKFMCLNCSFPEGCLFFQQAHRERGDIFIPPSSSSLALLRVYLSDSVGSFPQMMPSQIIWTQSLATISSLPPTNLQQEAGFLSCQPNCSSANSSAGRQCLLPQLPITKLLPQCLQCWAPHPPLSSLPHGSSFSLQQLSGAVSSVQHSCNNVPSPQLPGICSLLLQTPFPCSPRFPRTSQNTCPVSFKLHRLWDGR